MAVWRVVVTEIIRWESNQYMLRNARSKILLSVHQLVVVIHGFAKATKIIAHPEPRLKMRKPVQALACRSAGNRTVTVVPS
jgi:hypothetical protein